MLGNHNVLVNRKLFKQADILESTCDAQLGDSTRSLTGYFNCTAVGSSINNIAAGRRVNAGYHVKGGSFSSTVRAYQSHYFMFIDIYLQIIYSNNAAKTHRNAICF